MSQIIAQMQTIQCWFKNIILAIIFSLLIRVVLSIFKAFWISSGVTDNKENNFYPSKNWRFRESFCRSFLANSTSNDVSDQWLPFFLGFLEILAFPILMKADRLDIIGYWLGFTIAAKWSASRASYVRFLLGNILVLYASFFLYMLTWGK